MLPKEPEKLTSLSEVIRALNQTFGETITDADKISIEEWFEKLKNDEISEIKIDPKKIGVKYTNPDNLKLSRLRSKHVIPKSFKKLNFSIKKLLALCDLFRLKKNFQQAFGSKW